MPAKRAFGYMRGGPACCPCNDLLLSRTSSSVRHKKPATSEKGIPRASTLIGVDDKLVGLSPLRAVDRL
jgi:hypothetical protein